MHIVDYYIKLQLLQYSVIKQLVQLLLEELEELEELEILEDI